ncbi:MAG: hypothetical protein J7498_06765 [Sphingobium sp.]|nr:hypothetical protein [Sphingobium sp.]
MYARAAAVSTSALDDDGREVMDLYQQVPTPREVLVKNVLLLRNAEREGRFDEAVKAIGTL